MNNKYYLLTYTDYNNNLYISYCYCNTIMNPVVTNYMEYACFNL